jgi:transposase
LEHLFKTTPDRRRRDRCQAVLMASRGRKHKTIAQDLGVHRTTVRLWLKQYHERGVTGLQIHWARGQAGRIPEMLAPTIQAWVKDGPQSCGLDRANWTYEELATYLYQTTGIEVKRTAMRVFCQRHDIRPYRPMDLIRSTHWCFCDTHVQEPIAALLRFAATPGSDNPASRNHASQSPP